MKYLPIILVLITTITSDSLRRRSTIYIGSDDSLEKIYINENELDISELENKDDYSKVKKLEVTLFNYDEIQFEVTNKNELSNYDNAGLAVKIEYKDQYGKEKNLYTNLDDWECNGEKPIDKRTISKSHYPTWNENGLDDVKVIWANGNPKSAVCRFVVPKIQE